MKLNKSHSLYQEDINTILSVKGIEHFRNKSFLITGATGMVGVMLIDALMALDNVKVYAVGRSKANAFNRLGEYYDSPNFFFIEQDVRDPFPADLEVDYVIPGASNTHPLAYSSFPVETVMINVLGAYHTFELAKRCNAIVLYLSSVEIYGNARGDDDFDENYTGLLNLSNSRSCYTESKRVNEAICQSYLSEYGVKVKIARLSRIFGPTMLESDTKASSQFIKKALNGEDIVLKSKGDQFFSYTYVADVVAALFYILCNGEDGIAYNVSNSNCNVHLRDFAQMCAEFNGKQVVYDLPSDVEMKGYSIASKAILDNSRLLHLGFCPRYDMRTSVYRTIEILK